MRGTMGAGSGIVIDSVAVEEYRECLLKAEFLTRSAQRNASRFPMPHEFFLIETMLWDGGYPLLELHLDRLTDSADYFDIACQRAEVDAALEAHALRFADAVPRSPRKVRLLLGADGKLQITSETFADGFQAHPTPNRHPERAREANEPKDLRLFPFAAAFAAGERITASIVRGRICEERTDPRDPMLYHKTSHRPVYAKALREATQAGFDDVLFLNLRNELTEGAISNVFVEKDGRWFTPPVECGLLAGVFRRCLLETRPEIEERVLRLEDLRTADAIYLTNAVRGLRRVAIEW
jgi:para-aminobenzoate synthetase/4-amino-4-deoxychorismate lyase